MKRFWLLDFNSTTAAQKLIFNASLCVAEIQLPVIMNPASRWYREHMKHRVMNHYSNRWSSEASRGFTATRRVSSIGGDVPAWRVSRLHWGEVPSEASLPGCTTWLLREVVQVSMRGSSATWTLQVSFMMWVVSRQLFSSDRVWIEIW